MKGVYEKVRTVGLDRVVSNLDRGIRPQFSVVDDAEAPDVVARHVAEAVRRLIANEDSPTGRRYLNHRDVGTHVVLFVRDAPRNELGAAPFLCL